MSILTFSVFAKAPSWLERKVVLLVHLELEARGGRVKRSWISLLISSAYHLSKMRGGKQEGTDRDGNGVVIGPFLQII